MAEPQMEFDKAKLDAVLDEAIRRRRRLQELKVERVQRFQHSKDIAALEQELSVARLECDQAILELNLQLLASG